MSQARIIIFHITHLGSRMAYNHTPPRHNWAYIPLHIAQTSMYQTTSVPYFCHIYPMAALYLTPEKWNYDRSKPKSQRPMYSAHFRIAVEDSLWTIH